MIWNLSETNISISPSPEKLIVVVFLHHLPEEGEARRLDHLPHRQQHLRGLGGESDLPFLAANYLENFLVPHIFLSHVRKGSRNIIVGFGFVFSPCPNGPNPSTIKFLYSWNIGIIYCSYCKTLLKVLLKIIMHVVPV